MDKRFKIQAKKPKRYLLSGLEWVNIGYHDSACTCDVPLTILHPNDAYENPYLKGLVYEKGYVGTPRSKSNGLNASSSSSSAPKSCRNPHLIRLMVKDGKEKSHCSSEDNKDKLVSEDRPKYVDLDMSLGPTTVRKPFLVSGPHWASAKHTQRWPWKQSPLACQLWSRQSQDVGLKHTASHVACWSRHQCKKR